jgi:hypothetical protein
MTANHFFLDAVAGGIVAMGGLAVAFALRRWAYPAIHAQLRRLPWNNAAEMASG